MPIEARRAALRSHLAPMRDNAPDLSALQRIAANEYGDGISASAEFVANSAQSITRMFGSRACYATGEKAEMRITFDLVERAFVFADNGEGMDLDDLGRLLRLGSTGNARDARHGGVGAGGFEIAGADDSTSRFALSAYGQGALAGAAVLVRDTARVARCGALHVRSRQSAEGPVVRGTHDFGLMTLASELLGEPHWKVTHETSEMNAECEALVNEPAWGPRFTIVRVAGVNKPLCDKLLGDENERLKALAFFEELFFPLLHGSFDGIARTAPPGNVRVTMRITFVFGRGKKKTHVLGESARGRVRCVIPDVLRPHPTQAWLLQRNQLRIDTELEITANKADLERKQKEWGPSLSFTAAVTIALPRGVEGEGSTVQAILALFYLPECYDEWLEVVSADGRTTLEEFPEELCFGERSAGLIVVQSGQRLVSQPPIMPHFLREAMKRKANRAQRGLPDGCVGRIFGVLYIEKLPSLCALNRTKTSLQAQFVAAIENLDSQQRIDGTFVGRHSAAPRAEAPAVPPTSERARSLRPASAPLNAQIKLADAILEKWLPAMVKRDAGVRINPHDEPHRLADAEIQKLPALLGAGSAARCGAAHASSPMNDLWTIRRLSYFGVELDTHKAGGLHILYKHPDGRYNPLIAKVRHILCRGAKPGPHTTARDEFELYIERIAADEHHKEHEVIELSRVRKREWLSELKTSAEIEKVRLSSPDKFVFFAWVDSANERCSALEPLPSCMGVSAVTSERAGDAHAKYKTYRLPLPLEATLAPAGGGDVLKRWSNVRDVPTRNARGERVGWKLDQAHTPGLWHFDKLPDDLPPGEYLFTVETPRDFPRSVKGEQRLVVKPCAAAQLRCEWLPVAAVQMGGALPRLEIVATDERNRRVGVPPAVSIAQLTCAVTQAGTVLQHEITTSTDWKERREHANALASAAALYVENLQLKPSAGFALDSARGPCALIVSVTLREDAGLNLCPPQLLELVAGEPNKLVVAEEDSSAELLPGSRTLSRSVRALDRWGNLCSCRHDGSALHVRVVHAHGVQALDDGRVELTSAHGSDGLFVLPEMALTGDFGSEATIALALDPALSGRPAVEVKWRLGLRAIAFDGGAAALDEPPRWVDDDDGNLPIHRTTMRVRAGQSVDGLRVRAYRTDGTGGALGALDASFMPQMRRATVELQVGSDEPFTVQLAASIPSSVVQAPREVGARTIVHATLYGARAELVLLAVAGPAEQLCLEVAPSARAGASIDVRAVLRDSDGAVVDDVPNGFSFGLVAITVAASGRTRAPLAERVSTTDWRVEESSKGTAATCSLRLLTAGSYVLSPVLEATSFGDVLRVIKSAPVDVAPGRPSSLTLRMHDDARTALRDVRHGARFSLSATLLDAHDNALERTDEGTFEVCAADGTDLVDGPGRGSRGKASPRRCTTGRWDKLFARLADGRAPLPANGGLIVRWQCGALRMQAELPVHFVPTKREVRWVQLAAQPEPVPPGEEVEVCVKLLLDDGRPCPNDARFVKAGLCLEPAAGGARAASSMGQARPFSGDRWLLRATAPSTPGDHEWRVRATGVEPVTVRAALARMPRTRPRACGAARTPPARVPSPHVLHWRRRAICSVRVRARSSGRAGRCARTARHARARARAGRWRGFARQGRVQQPSAAKAPRWHGRAARARRRRRGKECTLQQPHAAKACARYGERKRRPDAARAAAAHHGGGATQCPADRL